MLVTHSIDLLENLIIKKTLYSHRGVTRYVVDYHLEALSLASLVISLVFIYFFKSAVLC